MTGRFNSGAQEYLAGVAAPPPTTQGKAGVHWSRLGRSLLRKVRRHLQRARLEGRGDCSPRSRSREPRNTRRHASGSYSRSKGPRGSACFVLKEASFGKAESSPPNRVLD